MLGEIFLEDSIFNINYHKLAASNSTHLLSHSFYGSGVHRWLIQVPRSQGFKEGDRWTVFSSRYSTGENSTFEFIQIVDIIYFLVVIGLCFSASYWLSAGGCPQVLVATHMSISIFLQTVHNHSMASGFFKTSRRICLSSLC